MIMQFDFLKSPSFRTTSWECGRRDLSSFWITIILASENRVRVGSDIDVINVQHVFQQIGYSPIIVRDVTAQVWLCNFYDMSNCIICIYKFTLPKENGKQTYYIHRKKGGKRCPYFKILSKKMEWIFTLFVTVTPWGVTSVITSFGVNIEWTGRDFTRWEVNFHSTGVRIEWNSLLNEWNFFTPMDGMNYSLDFREFSKWCLSRFSTKLFKY